MVMEKRGDGFPHGIKKKVSIKKILRGPFGRFPLLRQLRSPCLITYILSTL